MPEIVKSGELDEGVSWTLDKNGVFTVTAEEMLSEYSLVSVGYGESGEMKQCAYVSGTGAKMDTEGIKFIKIFIWESIKSMKPVCEAYRIEIKN